MNEVFSVEIIHVHTSLLSCCNARVFISDRVRRTEVPLPDAMVICIKELKRTNRECRPRLTVRAQLLRQETQAGHGSAAHGLQEDSDSGSLTPLPPASACFRLQHGTMSRRPSGKPSRQATPTGAHINAACRLSPAFHPRPKPIDRTRTGSSP
jgi:hypothetical protein